MKALIIQHEFKTPPGSTLEWLNQHRIEHQIIRIDLGETLPSVEGLDILFICGGSMDVDQEDKFSWLRDEKNFIKKCLSKNIKIVGLCLGSQLLAEALGAEVGPMGFPEIGWHEIIEIDQNKKVVSKIMGFQFHSYCFKSIPGTNIYLTNSIWPNQGFQYEQNILAFQFHPEADEDWINKCLREDPWPSGKFVQTRDQIQNQMFLLEGLKIFYFKSLDKFILDKSPLQGA